MSRKLTYISLTDDPPYVQVQTWLNSTEFAYRIYFDDCAKVMSRPSGTMPPSSFPSRRLDHLCVR